MDYVKLANDIVRLTGGVANIKTVSHCMTRLRFIVRDVKAADTEALKELDGVLGVVYAGGQFMVILGKNLLPVYEAVIKNHPLTEGAAVNENLDSNGEKKPLTVKGAAESVINYVSASVSPLIAGLVAGGMLKVVLLLLTLISPSFKETTTYLLLSGLADAPFYFMPIFVASGAAAKLGTTPVYAMICAGALLHGNYTGLVAAGEAVTLFGLPIRLVGYANSLLPALLIAVAASYAEKFFNKIVPGIFKSIFVGLGTIVVTVTLGFVVLGPLGSFLGIYLSYIFNFLGNTVGPVAVGLLTACLPWMVMCGMHMALVPFMTQAIADPGYDPVFRPAFILHNMAEGGACIGVALRTKNKALRSEALGIGFGCIVAGVTEPAIYGVNLRYKKPMYGVMAGGAAGGIVAGLLGARAYVMGYSTVMALPIFQNTIIAMAIAIVTAIVVSAAVTFMLGIDEKQKKQNSVEKVETAELTKPVDDSAIVAVAKAKMIPIDTVNDETFASKMMGDGVAFELQDNIIAAPCSGTITAIFPTGHAFGITRDDGVEVLIHIGINTVDLDGKGFTLLSAAVADQPVKAGEPLVKLDLDLLRGAGYDLTTMLIITNTSGKTITFSSPKEVSLGEVINS